MIKNFINFLRLIYQKKYLIFSMAKREVTTQYVGSLLGFVWTFIHPMVLISVFWFVFSIGFRIKPTNNVPFVVWLTAGFAPWFIFAEIVGGSVGVVVGNSNLIKKTRFPSQILPIVKIASCYITHAIFMLVLFGLIIFQKMPFSIYYLQFLYYLFCLTVFALGFAWIVSALNVFLRDIGQIVAVVLQVGMWATPILWDINIMSPKIQMFLKLNPVFYLVQGYRESFIYFKPFWTHPFQTIYFWVVAGLFFIIGAIIFQRLKYHFADVL